MRTTTRSNGTTGKTRGASFTTTLAALALALPMSGLFGGSALASATTSPSASSDHGKASAPGQDKKDSASSTSATAAGSSSSSPSNTDPAANQNTSSTPYTNAGGVTTGSNTTKYEVANGRSGSPAVGGGQPSGNIYSPQPYSTADQNNTGANDTSASNPYRSTRDGAPSLNGNGGGKQVGQPCAACVGKADNKNPAGQAPGGSDHNAGYECDRNHGIGRSNPAHTGCVAGTTPPPPVVTPCAAGTHMSNGSCVSDNPGTPCAAGTHMSNGSCVSDNPGTPCAAGTHMSNGTCVSDNPGTPCAAGTHMSHGTCVSDTPGTPKTCPNGTPMPSNEKCDTTGTPTNGGNKNDKITICHATGSASNPFVVITPNKNGVVHGHAKHGDDIIPPFSYNDHGVTKSFPGQNWTAANAASFANGCKTPGTPVVCPSGSTMGANGTCTTPVVCPSGSTMGANGTCTTPVVCPSGSTMVNGVCTPPATCPAGSTMVGSNCEFPAVCPAGPGTMVNGVCVLPTVCPAGSTQMPNGTCVVPVTGGTGGEAQGPGTVTGGTGGEAQGPGTVVIPTVTPGTPTPGVISNGGNPQPVLGGTPTPAVISARPTALPFTGANATLLAEGAALLLLLGGGLVLAARRKDSVTV